MSANSPITNQNDFSLERDAWGKLVLVDAVGIRHAGVETIRCFPIEDPNRYIVIRDQYGRELLFINDLAAIAARERDLIVADLAEREFRPVVLRVLRTGGETFPSDWEIVTDRGPTTIRLIGEDDIRRLGGGRVLIRDSHSIHFLIPEVARLDHASRKLLERFI